MKRDRLFHSAAKMPGQGFGAVPSSQYPDASIPPEIKIAGLADDPLGQGVIDHFPVALTILPSGWRRKSSSRITSYSIKTIKSWITFCAIRVNAVPLPPERRMLDHLIIERATAMLAPVVGALSRSRLSTYFVC